MGLTFGRRLRFLVVSVLSVLLLSVPTVGAGAADGASDDALRQAGVAQIVDVLESFAADHGSFQVLGSGHYNNGRGWFSYERSSRGYYKAISARLIELGYLSSSQVPVEPSSTFYKNDFMVYDCLDRVGVFSLADAIVPSPEDAAWWDDNGCNRRPLDTYSHPYFVLSAPLDSLGPVDEVRAAAVADAVVGLETWAAHTGDFVVPGTGADATGQGWWLSAGVGVGAIAPVLLGADHFDEVPADPEPGGDFVVARCGDRVAVFASGSGGEGADLGWWDANDCSLPVSAPGHDYMVLSRPLGEVVGLAVCGNRLATIVGTEAGELIHGTGGDDVIAALGGNDEVRAGAGDDRVCGGDGNDEVSGAAGTDLVFGGPGHDMAADAAGGDVFVGGDGFDLGAGRADEPATCDAEVAALCGTSEVDAVDGLPDVAVPSEPWSGGLDPVVYVPGSPECVQLPSHVVGVGYREPIRVQDEGGHPPLRAYTWVPNGWRIAAVGWMANNKSNFQNHFQGVYPFVDRASAPGAIFNADTHGDERATSWRIVETPTGSFVPYYVDMISTDSSTMWTMWTLEIVGYEKKTTWAGQPWVEPPCVDPTGDPDDFAVESLLAQLADAAWAAVLGCVEGAGTAVDDIVGALTDPVGTLGGIVSSIDQIVTELEQGLAEGDLMATLQSMAGGAIAATLELDRLKTDGEWDLTPDKVGNWVGFNVCRMAAEAATGLLGAKIADLLGDIRAGRASITCSGANSFAGDTLVLMADGSLERIDAVAVGDHVVSYNFDTSVWEPKTVVDQWSHPDRGPPVTVTANGAAVTATGDHPWWNHTAGEWTHTVDLSVGDQLFGPDGLLSVDNVTIGEPTDWTVWELTVADNHSFAVALDDKAALVHNGTRCLTVHGDGTIEYSGIGNTGDGRFLGIDGEYPDPHAGMSARFDARWDARGPWSHDGRLPDRDPDLQHPTSGVAEMPDGVDRLYTSGEDGPGSAFSHMRSHSHAEGHMAADMVAHNITEATITINNTDGPCDVCTAGPDHAQWSGDSVGAILGPGRTLHVEWWNPATNGWELTSIEGY